MTWNDFHISRSIRFVATVTFVAFSLNGCGPFSSPFAAQLSATSTIAPTSVPVATQTATQLPEPTSTPTVVPTQTSTAIPTSTSSPVPTTLPLSPTPTLAPLSADERSDLFQEAWELVRDRYVYQDYRGLDWEAVRNELAPKAAAAESPDAFYAVMHELIDRLGDDHSSFETPQDVAQEDARFEGSLNYVGIGAIIRSLPDGGLITRLARGGPAEEAGLRPRDLVIAIGSTPFTDTTAFGPGGPISAVRGTPNTPVTLTVRSSEDLTREVTIIRRTVGSDAFPEVEAERLPGTNIGLLRIDTFYLDHIDQQVRDALESLAQGDPLTGLIIDIRNNGGGRVDLMLNIVALFADGGSIGFSADRTRQRALVVPQGETLPQVHGIPVAVLIGEDTVSAAEMFAVGMRHLAGAHLIGTTSAGNTENLRSHVLHDGSRIWLAELVYLLPDGSSNEGHGVAPDQMIAAEWWRYATSDDPQIQAAIASFTRP